MDLFIQKKNSTNDHEFENKISRINNHNVYN